MSGRRDKLRFWGRVTAVVISASMVFSGISDYSFSTKAAENEVVEFPIENDTSGSEQNIEAETEYPEENTASGGTVEEAEEQEGGFETQSQTEEQSTDNQEVTSTGSETGTCESSVAESTTTEIGRAHV